MWKTALAAAQAEHRPKVPYTPYRGMHTLTNTGLANFLALNPRLQSSPQKAWLVPG